MMAYSLTTNASLITGSLLSLLFKLPLMCTTVLAIVIDLCIKSLPSVSYTRITQELDLAGKKKKS